MKQKYNQIIEKYSNKKKSIFLTFLFITFIISASLFYNDIFSYSLLMNGIPALIIILGEMFPPDFTNINTWYKPCLDSITMSISSTFLALIIALPLSFIAARNLSKFFLITSIVRLYFSIFRAIPDLVMGILIVAAVGFGSISGTLAIAIHSVGMLGKFISESIERSDEQITNIIVANGASKIQVLRFGILPQIYQELVDLVMYRWEYNFRQSTIMGIVGAGGIGFELIMSLRLMNYQEVFAILLIIFVLITAVDSLSYIIRNSSK